MSVNPPLVPVINYVDGTVLFASQLNSSEQQILNWINTNGRTGISTNMTLYVSPTGSDANNGMSATAPFATITAAYNSVLSSYGFQLQAGGTLAQVTIQLAPGTYNESVNINGIIPGQRGPAQVVIIGNPGAPTTTVITGDPCMYVTHGACVTVQGVQFTGPTDGLFATHAGQVHFLACDFGACAQNQFRAKDGGSIAAWGNYSISGSAGAHGNSSGSGSVSYISNRAQDLVDPNVAAGPTVTLNGTPSFTQAFAVANFCGYMDLSGMLFTGSATGPQYLVTSNASIRTNTNGTMVLPGSLAGVQQTGGIYL
jgi:hypothetical protein